MHRVFGLTLFSMNLSNRFWNSVKECFFWDWIVSILTLLYKSGKRMNFSHKSRSDCNVCSMSLSIINPFSDMSGSLFLPASVISLIRSNRLHLSLFSSVQLLRIFLGPNFCTVMPFSFFFIMLSIHPKHIASSTASTYQNVLSF
ncbi:hypothetical protein IMSAGC014_00584 [Bacteroidaceae bacterium]|nr:hypothetical protein IMSAGC014_00584 [Bacteroidaceae bacterium]